MAYLVITAGVACLIAGGGSLVLVHAWLITAILAFRRGPRWLHDLYPLLLVPLLYFELDLLSQIAGGKVYDELVLVWENALFGETPALWLSERFPCLWFSEFCHACYLCFYLLIPALAFRLYGRPEFHRFLLGVESVYLISFLIQIVFPVLGPRPLLPPLAPELQGPMWWLCHYLAGQGAAAAAAFPSSHVAIGAAVAVGSFRFDRASFPFFAIVFFGLSIATVYGRFHYAVDGLAGVALVALVEMLVTRWKAPKGLPNVIG